MALSRVFYGLLIGFFVFVHTFSAFSSSNILSKEQLLQKIKEDPENIEVLTQLALIYAAEKDYLKAVETNFKILKLSPNNFHAYNNLGIIYKKAGQYKDSLFCYQKALQLDPQNYLVHFNMGLAYEAMGRMQEAREAYGRALSLNPNFTQALDRLQQLSEEPGKVVALPTPVGGHLLVVDSPNSSPKSLVISSEQQTKSEKVSVKEKAEKQLSPVAKSEKKPVEKPTRSGTKKTSEMIRTMKTGPGASFYNKALNAMDAGDMNTAIEQYVACILQDREFLSEPDFGLIRKALALLKDRPNCLSEGLFYRGYLQLISGNRNEALADLKQYLESNKKGPFRSQCQAIVEQIEAEIEAEKEAEAAKLAAEKLASLPEIVSAATYTPRMDDEQIEKLSVEEVLEEAKRLSREGRLRDAIAVLRTALERDRENLQLLVAMANAYTDLMLLQGDNEAGKMARDIFEKILRIAPSGSKEAILAKNMAIELNNRLR